MEKIKEVHSPKSIEHLANIYEEFCDKPCPFDAFPPRIKEVCDHIALAQNLPKVYLYFTALGIISGCVGRSYLATNACNNKSQKPNLFLIGLGSSSTGKSLSINVLGERLKKLDDDAYDKFVKESESLKSLVDEMTGEKKSKKDKMKPRNESFIVGNCTSEALSERLQQSGGTLFSVLEESRDILQIVSGAYRKEGDDTEIYNRAWSGEPLRYNRVLRGLVYVKQTCLSALWLSQYDSFISAVVDKKSSSISVFAPRFIVLCGPDDIKEESDVEYELDATILDKWNEFIERLYFTRKNCETPNIIRGTSEARKVFRDFHNLQVRRMNGTFRSLKELMGKTRENAIRLSLIFAIAEDSDEITEDIAKRACEVMEYSVGSMVRLFSNGLISSLHDRKNRIVKVLEEKGGTFAVSRFMQMYGISRDYLMATVMSFPDTLRIRKNDKGKGEIVELISDDNTETSTAGITGESIGEITSEKELSPPDDDEPLF